jgi:hypothetical protein
MRTPRVTLAAAAAALLAAAPAHAFTSTTAQGNTPADIQPAVDAYRAVLGGDNLDQPGSQGGGRREVSWDDVPEAAASPTLLSPTYYDVEHPRGLVVGTPGRGFAASRQAQPRFSDIDPSYAGRFSVFSPQRLFTPLGSNVTEVTFRVPATDTPALVRGFGAVFTSVDVEGPTRLDYFGPDGAALGSVTPKPGALSFAEGRDPKIARVRITTGNAALAAGTTDDATHDVVAMDDFIYGEPEAPLAEFHMAQAAYAVHENDGGIAVAVHRSGGLAAASVHVATVPDTAEEGDDYRAVSQVLAFAAGESTTRPSPSPSTHPTAGSSGRRRGRW